MELSYSYSLHLRPFSIHVLSLHAVTHMCNELCIGVTYLCLASGIVLDGFVLHHAVASQLLLPVHFTA